MTSKAVGTCGSELSSDMARSAFESGVGASQCEPSKFQVIEVRRVPGIHAGMARHTVCREPERLVVRRRGLLIHLRVARETVR